MKAEPASSELAAAPAGAAPASGVTASRRLAIGLALVAGAGFTTLAYLRFATFHNGNFDLGFYTRMAWGLAHGDAWDPIVGADVRGLHLSPVVGVIGWIARVTTLPLPPLLLAAQGLAVALATWPMARIGERHLGRWGALLGASVWLLHPNLGHVASYDFHPGTLAVLPLALACDAVDARRLPALGIGIAGVACCREDLVLPAALLATLLAVSLRRRGWPTRTWLSAAGLGAAAIGYLAYWALVLHPMYAPPVGSLELHFGRLGGSVSEVAITLLTRPHVVLADAVREGRAWQLPLLLLPLAFAPLLSPRWLVAAAPVLVLNMLSTWPNTQGLYTHYATPILPMLATAAIVGAGKLRGRFGRAGVVASCAPALAAVIGHVLVGGTPASVFWDRAAIRDDPRSREARAILALVPPGESVQAPDALIAHVAERVRVHAAPPPEIRTDWAILDVSHRVRLRRRGDVLRSTEEPWARALSRRWALRGATPRYLLFRRWRPPRSGLFRHYLGARFTEAELPAPIRLTGCLALTHAGVFGSDAGPATFAFAFRADGPCPDDLALRLAEVRPRDTIDPRTVVNDLLCDGLASPALFGEGDVVWSVHDPIGLRVRDAAREGVLVGLVRESGARPERSDPTWVEVPLRRLAGLPPRGAWTMR